MKKSKKDIKYSKLKNAPKVTPSINETLYMCHYCQEYFEEEELTLDHKIPSSNGGKTSMENIELCCKKCNFVKGRIFYHTFVNFIKRIGLKNYKEMVNNLLR